VGLRQVFRSPPFKHTTGCKKVKNAKGCYDGDVVARSIGNHVTQQDKYDDRPHERGMQPVCRTGARKSLGGP